MEQLGKNKNSYTHIHTFCCCCCSVIKLCLTLCDPMDCSMPGFPVIYCLPEFAQTHVYCRWCHPTISFSVTPFSSCPQSFPASESFPLSQLFVSGGQNIGASPSNENSGLISSRIDWSDLLAVQGILKSLLQHHNSKASILWRLAFFMVLLSYPYMTTGKTIALTIQTFVSKVMSLLFNTLSSKVRRSYGFKWMIREELFVKAMFKQSLEEVLSQRNSFKRNSLN